jgi:hypothetical protein
MLSEGLIAGEESAGVRHIKFQFAICYLLLGISFWPVGQNELGAPGSIWRFQGTARNQISFVGFARPILYPGIASTT